MSIDVAAFGELARDPERKISKAGKPYLKIGVRVGSGDSAQWLQALVFNEVDELGARLAKGTKVYVEGALSADAWLDKEGKARVGLSVMAFRCVETHQIGRNRPKRERPATDRPKVAANGPGQDRLTADAGFHDDEIPF